MNTTVITKSLAPEGLSPYSQEPATGPYPKPTEPLFAPSQSQ
jgi:hypothetical protein